MGAPAVSVEDHVRVDEDDPLQPIKVIYYRYIFVPDKREELVCDFREIHTYYRCVDLDLQGEIMRLLYFPMQRIEAKLLSLCDESSYMWTRKITVKRHMFSCNVLVQ